MSSIITSALSCSRMPTTSETNPFVGKLYSCLTISTDPEQP